MNGLILAATLNWKAFRAEGRAGNGWKRMPLNRCASSARSHHGQMEGGLTPATGPPCAPRGLAQAHEGEKGWGAPTWPVEYGGGGLEQRPQQALPRVLQQEMDPLGA